MRYDKTLNLGDIRYRVTFDTNHLNHLCSFRELSNLSLTKFKYSSQFDTKTVVKDPHAELDLKIFRSLFITLLRDSHEHTLGGSLKGFLYSAATGNRSRWGYVGTDRDNNISFLDLLPVSNTLILYSEEDNEDADSVAPGTEEETGIEQLTMFNISTKGLNDIRDPETKTYIESKLAVVNEQLHTELTESSIRDYLRGNHAA